MATTDKVETLVKKLAAFREVATPEDVNLFFSYFQIHVGDVLAAFPKVRGDFEEVREEFMKAATLRAAVAA